MRRAYVRARVEGKHGGDGGAAPSPVPHSGAASDRGPFRPSKSSARRNGPAVCRAASHQATSHSPTGIRSRQAPSPPPSSSQARRVDPFEPGPVHLRDECVLRASLDGLAEFKQDRFEHLGLRDPRVEHECRLVALGVELVEEGAAEGGLAAADLADEHNKALPLLNPVFQVLKRIMVRRAQVEKLRVRGDVERHFPETVEL